MIDFEKTCRTCMKTKSDVTTLISLFGPLKIEDNWSLKLADVLKETITLQITEEDGLPQNLCDECVKNLHIMYTFRNQALNSDNELRKIVSASVPIKNEKEVALKHESEFDYSYDEFIYNNTHTTKIESSDDLSMYICNICNKKFTKRKRFLKHLTNHEDPKVSCSICGKTFHRQTSLNRHLNKHCTANGISDNLSSNTVANFGVKVEYEGEFKCTACNFIFESQNSLLLHLKEHRNICIDLEEQLYGCIKCSISYSSLQQLMNHLANHKGQSDIESELLEIRKEVKHHQCPECHMVFEKQRSLASHLKKHKIKMSFKSQKLYYCDHCNKGFTLKALLRRHMKLHCGDRPYKCTRCSKSYTRQDQLVMHISKHDGTKRYACSHCDKAFTQLCSLKDHERTHTGETPFLCSQCGKGFSNNSNLRQHLRRHSGLKPFACNLCPKSFCTKGQMKSHMDTHTGVHPHKCNECGASFTKTNSLKKHSLIHLEAVPLSALSARVHTEQRPGQARMHVPRENIYQCTVCQAKFRLMRELKRHYPIHYINGAEPTPVQESPLVVLKGCSEQDIDNEIPTDRQITITFNSNVLDKNSIGDITINIEPGKITLGGRSGARRACLLSLQRSVLSAQGSVDDAARAMVHYTTITPEMSDAVLRHLRDSFFADEPLNKAVQLCQRGQPHAALERLCVATMADGLSIAALDEDTIQHSSDAKFNKIFTILYTVSRDLDLFHTFQVDRILECRIISVSQQARGQGLARELMKRSIETAMDKGFKVCSTTVY
ncbi:jg19582 [Pararge aegeria aegeria]|uniref:Jg19582 protein n=1 Tax=Pararge aegeria aegeria TaxID=348720 RepID=A0A8S4R2N8_9NEOP|nr:jg19582 [Pararge aegeria aegeria]